MKKYLPIVATITTLFFVFVGCNFFKPLDQGQEYLEEGLLDIDAPEGPEAGTEVTEPASTGVDYEAVYADVLNVVYYMLNTGDAESYSRITGLTGVWEYSNYNQGTDSVGYVFKDVTKDGFDDLLLTTTEDGRDSVIAVYSAPDEATVPVNLIEGWSRNTYFLLEDESFLNYGSGGWATNEFSKCEFINGELCVTDMYFTDLLEDGQTVGVFHNNNGFWDTEYSERLDMNDEEFFDLYVEWEENAQALDPSPMSAYGPKAGDPSTNKLATIPAYIWISDADYIMGSGQWYNYYKLDDSEYAVELGLSTDGTVKNVTFYTIMANGFDEDKLLPVYSVGDLLCTQDEFTPEEPIIIKLSFAGDMANYGFTYEDSAGYHYCAINMSGYDGSAYIDEFIPAN